MRVFRHQITEWKSTGERYIAIVQSMERFEPSTFREIPKGPHETWVVGRLRGTMRDDLYAIGLKRMAMEYGEARERARAAVDQINALMEQGKEPFGP